MQRPHRLSHGSAHDGWLVDLLCWAAVGLIVLLNLVMMWRIATATV